MWGEGEGGGRRGEYSDRDRPPAGLVVTTLHTRHRHHTSHLHLTPPTHTRCEDDVIVYQTPTLTQRSDLSFCLLLPQWSHVLHLLPFPLPLLLSLFLPISSPPPHSQHHPVPRMRTIPITSITLRVKGHLHGSTVDHSQCSAQFRDESNHCLQGEGEGEGERRAQVMIQIKRGQQRADIFN